MHTFPWMALLGLLVSAASVIGPFALLALMLRNERANADSIEAINAAWRRDLAHERAEWVKERAELLNRIQRPETLGQAPADRKPRQPWSDQREADIARKQEEANGRPLR